MAINGLVEEDGMAAVVKEPAADWGRKPDGGVQVVGVVGEEKSSRREAVENCKVEEGASTKNRSSSPEGGRCPTSRGGDGGGVGDEIVVLRSNDSSLWVVMVPSL